MDSAHNGDHHSTHHGDHHHSAHDDQAAHDGDHHHHHEAQQMGLRAFMANLKLPGPFGWKLRRTLANTATKAVRRQPCCGHPGEPGC